LYNLAQKLAAELIGTFAIVFIASGSICADQYLSISGQTRIGLLGASLAYGLAYAAMVIALGHISGGHFNPAVTVGCWVVKRLGTFQAIGYGVAQLAGSIAAAYLIRVTIPETAWRPGALGAPEMTQDFTRLHAMGLEALLSFILVFVIFATSANEDFEDRFHWIAGLAIGSAITMGALVGGPFTGAAMNPARAFGPALATPHWQNQGVYWVGPLFGSIIAAFLYHRLFGADQALS
jgi:MIP family channel proteins